LNRIVDPRREPPLTWHVVAGSDGTGPWLVLTWVHPLMDPRGAELLVAMLDAVDRGEEGARWAADRLVAPPADPRPARERAAPAPRDAASPRARARSPPVARGRVHTRACASPPSRRADGRPRRAADTRRRRPGGGAPLARAWRGPRAAVRRARLRRPPAQGRARPRVPQLR